METSWKRQGNFVSIGLPSDCIAVDTRDVSGAPSASCGSPGEHADEDNFPLHQAESRGGELE
jgi:hypothetical protein